MTQRSNASPAAISSTALGQTAEGSERLNPGGLPRVGQPSHDALGRRSSPVLGLDSQGFTDPLFYRVELQGEDLPAESHPHCRAEWWERQRPRALEVPA